MDTLKRHIFSVVANFTSNVHGVLWVLDEILQAKAAEISQLYAALQLFQNDPTVRLPSRELNARLKRYGELLDP